MGAGRTVASESSLQYIGHPVAAHFEPRHNVISQMNTKFDKEPWDNVPSVYRSLDSES